MSNGEITLAVLKNDVEYLKDKINQIDYKLDRIYVTKTEFEPIKNLAYGVMGLILTALIGGAIAFLFL